MPTLSGSERRRLAQCCHALSDETRLRILDRLSAAERCVCEFPAAIGPAPRRSIVAAHGGKIEATSELGKGSSFIVILPRFEAH